MKDVAAEVRGFPFQIRGSLQTVLSLRLLRPDDPDLFRLLVDKIAHSPDFFRQAPIVLDVAPIAQTPPIDLAAFVDQLRQQKLVPVGIQNGSPEWNEAAAKAGLAVLGAGGTAPASGRPQQPAAATAAPPPQPQHVARGSGMVVTEPVRSGQQIYCGDGDLVVLASVGSGAEVAASGHVHVYGALRGRAFAGVEGDSRSMIFCDQLHAELLSIGGVYLVSEEIDRDAVGRRARVSCANERLFVTPLP
ncbi:MAG TPA: septum site-determining protein MinC [Geminicoccaceae bacterium]|nr:septum site-determining protein MinC [Geminicoccus sp.]HMU50909.1 septum site-determining protein MinC [Geminicoccaceae bacterium]